MDGQQDREITRTDTAERVVRAGRGRAVDDDEETEMEIAGTAALVTGAASGLGAATAAELAGRGASVYGLDLERAIVAATPTEGVLLLPADVTDEAQVRTALARVEDDGQQLRLAVSCAGIGPSARILSRRGPHDLELFHTVLKVNLLGTFNVLRLAAEAMSRLEPDAQGQRGVVVNTASIAAFEAQIGQIAYAASKAGVAGMTVTAARDLAQYGIRVMSIAPGIVDTPMMAGVSAEVRAGLAASVPFPRRLAQPAEFARLVAMIAELDYLNGETIRMDGALRMAPR
jgi:NAD(P)-dependent dehydrogenase (short-subunit alcohol dehydrogenase family)